MALGWRLESNLTGRRKFKIVLARKFLFGDVVVVERCFLVVRLRLLAVVDLVALCCYRSVGRGRTERRGGLRCPRELVTISEHSDPRRRPPQFRGLHRRHSPFASSAQASGGWSPGLVAGQRGA